ncbi:MAG TPA: hypothetical protein VFT72_03360 [Opitutaceae bacterium]|nr:hypothetical protein [Opitutaceae bacterium]
MSLQTSESAGWATRHHETLIDAATLLAALNLWPALARLPHVSFGVQAATLLALAFLTPPKLHLVEGIWRRYIRMLPRLVGAVAVGVFCLYKFYPPVLPGAWFGAVWLVLTALSRFWLGSSTQTRQWIVRTRLDVTLGDLGIVGLFAFALPRLLNLPPPNLYLLGAAGTAWVVTQSKRLGGDLTTETGFRANTRLVSLAMPLAFALGWLISLKAAPLAVLVFTLWLAFALWMFRRLVRTWGFYPDSGGPSENRERGVKEVVGWIALGLIVTREFFPYFRARVFGGGDGFWYATVLADVIEQLRHGEFPVFVGRSIYQFNGAVFPIRIAPGISYLGSLLDLLTLHTLVPSAVLNLVLALTGFAATAVTYVCARKISRSSLLAWCLAVLLISGPGSLAVVFMDLFMSWVTLPWVVASVYLAAVSFERSGAKFYLIVGFVLGAIWWLHTPIAMWLSLVVSGIHLIRFGYLIVKRGLSARFAEVAAGALSFGVIASYPLVSAIGYPADVRLGTAGGFTVPVWDVTRNLAAAFPKAWLPLSEGARQLSDFQLGYGLTVLFVIAVVHGWRKSGVRALAFFMAIGGLLVLLLPIPKLNAAIWGAFPSVMLSVTNSWPMQRLYLILSATTVMAIAILLARSATAASLRRTNSRAASGIGGIDRANWFHLILVLACGWSLLESLKFTAYAPPAPRGPAALTQMAPENVPLTRYSYDLFKGRPKYFSHGVMDSSFENRILTADMSRVLTSNYAIAGEKTAARGEPEAIAFKVAETQLVSERPIMLQPGRRYVLRLVVDEGARVEGVLVLKGRTFDRIYALPATGEAKAFGLGGERVPYVSIFTSQAEAEPVKATFIANDPSTVSAVVNTFSLQLQEIDPGKFPIQVTSWLPYRAKLNVAESAWLETPRLYQADYCAKVNGVAAMIQRSPENLVAVKLSPGENAVEVCYVAPLAMKVTFWTAMVGLFVAVFYGARRFMVATVRFGSLAEPVR